MENKSIAVVNKLAILKMVEAGIELAEIASIYNITPSAISNQLAADHEYRVSRCVGLESKLNKREKELEEATDMLSVSRGRELLKLAQWKCERLNSEVYGNQPKLQINIGVDTSAALETDARSLVAKIKPKA